MPETFKFSFDGKLASEGVLDIYDAARWLYGSARVFQIIAPYYATGKIISQAPRSSIQVTIIPPRRGTFIEEIAVAVLGGLPRLSEHVWDECTAKASELLGEEELPKTVYLYVLLGAFLGAAVSVAMHKADIDGDPAVATEWAKTAFDGLLRPNLMKAH